MAKLQLIYFEGCPNAQKTKEALDKIGAPFDLVRQDELKADDPLKNYSSPTILLDNEIIIGSQTGAGGGCSLDITSLDQLNEKLKGVSPYFQKNRNLKLLSAFGSFGSAITVGLCPICIPAIGGFLSALGLGFVVQEKVLFPLLLIFIAITIAGLAWSYFKEHKNIWPLILGSLMGLFLYLGRYVYFSEAINNLFMYGGIIGIIVVSFWNMRLKKAKKCTSCACEIK